jgi:hypothetical protein
LIKNLGIKRKLSQKKITRSGILEWLGKLEQATEDGRFVLFIYKR